MGSKSKNDALAAIEEHTAYRWELLRRNADYRGEYDNYFRKYRTKKEVELLELPEEDDSMSTEEWNEKFQAWERRLQEYQSRTRVTYKDIQEIQKVKRNPSATCTQGEAASFCGCWSLRYPKNYLEDFERKTDWTLFYDHGWINSAGWDLPAYGSSSHLDEILADYAIDQFDAIERLAHAAETSLESNIASTRNFCDELIRNGNTAELETIRAHLQEQETNLEVLKKNPSYASAIAALRESQGTRKEDGARRRKNGERLIVINTNFSDDMIFAYVSKLLEQERNNAPRKQLRLDNQWHLSFEIWDARQAGKTFPKIQEIIFAKADRKVNWEVSTITRRYKAIDKEIRKMSARDAARRT